MRARRREQQEKKTYRVCTCIAEKTMRSFRFRRHDDIVRYHVGCSSSGFGIGGLISVMVERQRRFAYDDSE